MKKGKHYTLFIIEEGEACTFLLKYKLQKSPEYKIEHFHSAEQLLENSYLHPDVIIVDEKLGGLNGPLVLETLKKHFQKIPVIILSSPVSSSSFLEYMHHGIYDYLIKEEDSARLADKLINRIVRILKEKESRDNDLQYMKIMMAIVALVLSIVAIFWIVY